MMTAKLINVDGSKIKIQLTLELSRSMLDTEINIQKGLNEVGCIASKEALKYLRYGRFTVENWRRNLEE